MINLPNILTKYKIQSPAIHFQIAKDHFEANFQGQSGYTLNDAGDQYTRVINAADCELGFNQNDGKYDYVKF